MEFQHEDGSFSFLSDYRIPSDARVLYIYRPTYACCQALMHAVLLGEGNDRLKACLARGLAFCCTRKLIGHGIDALRQQIEDVTDFGRCGIMELSKLHANLCPEFFQLIDEITRTYEDCIASCDVFEGHGEFLAAPMMRALESLGRTPSIPVFVYGTLMSGMPNAHLIEGSPFAGSALVQGYTLYDLGAFPAIVKSGESAWNDDRVYGELRFVDADTLEALNHLEDEGCLYSATKVTASVGLNEIEALAYVYLHEVPLDSEIPVELQPYSKFVELKNTHVWYACYGSNVCYERFMNYIAGGTCRYNGRVYPGCDDKTPPMLSSMARIPHEVYFGNSSGSWNGAGTAFLDTSKPGNAFCRVYLITKEQYEQIRTMEGRGANWYRDEVDLGLRAGIPVKTFTNHDRRPANKPSQEYLDAMRAGLKETYFRVSDERLECYLSSCCLA